MRTSRNSGTCPPSDWANTDSAVVSVSGVSTTSGTSPLLACSGRPLVDSVVVASVGFAAPIAESSVAPWMLRPLGVYQRAVVILRARSGARVKTVCTMPLP